VVILKEITQIDAPMERCFHLARSIEVHQLGGVRSGAKAVAGVTSGLIGMGQRVTWKARHFGIWQHLTSEITALDPPYYFQDRMVQGAFRFMRHDHFFRVVSAEQTEMIDVFGFAAPLPVLGLLAEHLILRRYMRNLLLEQSSKLKEVAESQHWQIYLQCL
jgi:ligand-binding SRPBCC domain-containing protein